MRISVTAAVLACVLAGFGASAGAGTGATQSRSITSRADLNRSILAEVNAVRVAKGLRPLRVSPELASAANQHSRAMARAGFFAHESADGRPFWRRVALFYRSAGFRSWTVGEDLLWVSPDVGAKEAVSMWLRSPAHRQVLLTRDYRELGLAAVHTTAAPGAFRGLEVTIVTADFGARSK
jgi:uncharacterized protein YkwD